MVVNASGEIVRSNQVKRMAGCLVAGLMLCLALVAPTQAVGLASVSTGIPQITGLSVASRDSELAVTWDAIDLALLPVSTAQESSWQVVVSVNPGNFDVSFPATQSDVVVSGLTNGQTYDVKVRLSDSVRSGQFSPSVVATPAEEQISSFIVQYESGQKPVAPNGTATGGTLANGTILDPGLAIGSHLRTVDLPKSVTLTQANDIAAELTSDPAIQWAEPDTWRYPTVATKSVLTQQTSEARTSTPIVDWQSATRSIASLNPAQSRAISQGARFGTVPAGLPKLPTDRRIIFTVDDKIMTATWSKFSGIGAISYTVTASAIGVPSKSCVTSSVTCRFTNLVNGRSYQVLVTAKNSKGSTSLAKVNSPTVGVKSTAPLSVSAVNYDIPEAKVSWTAPLNAGTGSITKYVASAFLDSSGGSAVASCTALNSTSCFIDLPQSGVSYFYGVRAVTNVGTGPESEVRATSTLVPGFVANDTYFVDSHNYQWYLKSDTASHGIRADRAWRYTTGDSQLVVGVIDTGITSHPDLDANMVAGYDFISSAANANDQEPAQKILGASDRDSNPADTGDWHVKNGTQEASSWHGTHVTGTIAAVGGNNRGVVGVAPTVKFQPLRALGKNGGLTSDEIAAINWGSGGNVVGLPANATPAKVLNLSMGGVGGCSQGEQTAIDAARARGVTVVVAAGNDFKNTAQYSPANCDGVIAVAASGPTGSLASYSNWGAPVDILAPGGDGDSFAQSIVNTINSGTTSPGNPTYAGLEGTSMATPIVSGVIALMLSMNPNLSPDRIEQLVKASAQSGTKCATATPCGAGLIDADKAVRLAAAG